MDPKKTTPLTDPGKSKKSHVSKNEEMDAPHKIGETDEENDIVPESEEVVNKQTDEGNNSSSQRDELQETLGIDDDDLETNEEEVVN